LLVTAQTNFPLNTNALAPHQFITTNSPPQSPATFTPDFGVSPSRYNPNPPAQPAVGTRWITNTPPEPAAPGMFNPDPGAMLKSQPVNAPFFTNSFAAPPVYRGEAIPAGLTLPRTNVRSERLEITNAPGGH
jgi:hypothetical protein